MSSSSFFFFLFPEQGKPGPVNTFPSHGSRVLQLAQTLANITESLPCADIESPAWRAPHHPGSVCCPVLPRPPPTCRGLFSDGSVGVPVERITSPP